MDLQHIHEFMLPSCLYHSLEEIYPFKSHPKLQKSSSFFSQTHEHKHDIRRLSWVAALLCPLCHLLVTDMSVLCRQVEHQYSHRFRVTVVRAENVTKGALGDLRECDVFFFFF